MDEPDPPPPSSILARADALMQRRRGAGEAEDLPVLTDVVPPDDDLPRQPPTAVAPAPDSAAVAALADELATRVRARLAAELPSLVEAALQSALAGLTEHLQEGIGETTAGALRDFLAERGD